MMKPEIDFYLLKQNQLDDCLLFACQLIAKAYQQGHSLKVTCTQESTAIKLDQLLWEYQDDSFIPHGLCNQKTSYGILIGSAQLSAAEIKIQLNVELSVEPTTPDNWERLLQIVPNTPKLLQIAREHYRFYRQAGYQIRNHSINK